MKQHAYVTCKYSHALEVALLHSDSTQYNPFVDLYKTFDLSSNPQTKI